MIKMHHGYRQAAAQDTHSFRTSNSLHVHVYTLAILNTLIGTIHDILFYFTNKVYRINLLFCIINIIILSYIHNKLL